MSRAVSSGSFQRAYTVAPRNVKAIEQPAASMAGKVGDHSDTVEVGKGVEKEIFWMRDPKTGNWMPETHFNEVDAADIIASFLSKKP